MKRQFNKLAYEKAEDLVFGKCLHPVKCGLGLEIGGGQVYPEVNYTLPPMDVEANYPKARQEYIDMVREILERSAKLSVPGLVLEFEHTFDMTDKPAWGAEVTADIKKLMQEFFDKHGLKSALRVTVADTRDRLRPPQLRSGPEFDKMMQSFELCAKAGADILSIESTGGKEISDSCIMECDIKGIVFSVGLLGSRDMEFLWDKIVGISDKYNVVPGGDTDCAHSNTAMRLAFMGYVPQVFAALVRAVGGARSLVAFEQGAVGPHKDCGYEGPIVKAITGMPIAMEGKGCACAHASYMGNVASAACDLWSNESVQHVRLLGGWAPEVFAEVLTYDCRLMNQALDKQHEHTLQHLMVESDIHTSPEALIIAPESAIRIARAIISHKGYYRRSLAAALEALAIISESVKNGTLTISDREQTWLENFGDELKSCPESEEAFIKEMMPKYETLFNPKEYGLK
jgi:methanol--5-hydroxybenzimidazolylcobamide Co-methyltransferase